MPSAMPNTPLPDPQQLLLAIAIYAAEDDSATKHDLMCLLQWTSTRYEKAYAEAVANDWINPHDQN